MTETVWPVVELRQYTLHPGTRDTMIDLFDRELVETQEAVGMRIVGQFRDEDDPDRFVWIRAFPDMASRDAALNAFYVEGAAWRTHAPAARATMVDTSNALLLQPVSAQHALRLTGKRPGVAVTDLPDSRLLATIFYPDTPLAEFAPFFNERVRRALLLTGGTLTGLYVTDPTPNTFAPLPVRDERAVVVFSLFESAAWREAHLRALAEPTWSERVLPELGKWVSRPIERLRLAPTARSLLR
ncbi:NIPSNAP family protein [Nocardia brasiliensis]